MLLLEILNIALKSKLIKQMVIIKTNILLDKILSGKYTFDIVKFSNDFLLCNVPNDHQIISAATCKQVRVMWAPRDCRDGLFMFRHDCMKFELIITVIQLKRSTTSSSVLCS